MSDVETVEDTANCSRAEVADDSCTVDYIEIVPLDRPSDDCEIPEVIPPLFEIKPELDLEEIKRDLDEEHDNVDSHLTETVDTPAFDDHTAEVVKPVVVFPPEAFQDLMHESDIDYINGIPQYRLKEEDFPDSDTEGPCFAAQVI